LYIDRQSRRLYVLDKGSHIIFQDPVGVGRGSLRIKRSMGDLVTPTGEFLVDLILYKDKGFDAVSADDLRRYKNSRFSTLISSESGLARLFTNMNQIDFNNDGKADHAYGEGYIGISSLTGAITGPKMYLYGNTPYWYSIALHGTSQPQNIGGTNSGGCVNVNNTTIAKLIEKALVKIGTRVTIADCPPKRP